MRQPIGVCVARLPTVCARDLAHQRQPQAIAVSTTTDERFEQMRSDRFSDRCAMVGDLQL